MAQRFRLLATPGYQRDLRSLAKRNPALISAFERILDILERDPYNTSRQHPIKKHVGIKPGEGQWRIRLGSYRLRYDIVKTDVVLYSFRHRKEAY